MTANTKIEWADHTFNPWEGCQKAGPGCDHCYAEARNARFGGGVASNWGPGAPRRRTSEANWKLPERWNAQAEAFQAQHGRRQRVFCGSLCDWADNAVPVQWRIDLMRLILSTPNMDWLLLTKRIGNAADMLETAFRACHGQREGWADNVPPNLWIGATIVNQEEADRDIPKLLAVPAAKRFLSIEPLLGAVNLRSITDGEGEIDALKPDRWEEAIELWRGTSDTWEEDFEDWFNVSIPAEGLSGPMHAGIDCVIVGGESGPHARPMHPDWARSLRDQCEAAGVPFMFKQWGEWTEFEPTFSRTISMDSVEGKRLSAECDGFISLRGEFVPDMGLASKDEPYRGVVRPGKKAAGRQLDGRTWDGIPA